MASKAVIYCKRSGERPVPVTARVVWLPDGTIQPRVFWMPDGTRCDVAGHSPGVPFSFFKEGGVGLRFKICGTITETPNNDAEELAQIRHETYLYLADARFSQRNIIDARYSNLGKEFITVTLDVFPGGGYELIDFTVRGARYKVEKTLDVAPRGSFQAGGVGIRHKVEARLVNPDDDSDPDPRESVVRFASVYLEMNKWFVCVEKGRNGQKPSG